MSNKSSLINQILIGILISIISAFIISKLGFEKIGNKKINIWVFEGKTPPYASDRCVDCRISMTVEEEATEHKKIYGNGVGAMMFILSLKEDQSKISYEITFSGTYYGIYYNNKYNGRASLSDSDEGVSRYTLVFATSSRPDDFGFGKRYLVENIYLHPHF
jgi:hypothetical protein